MNIILCCAAGMSTSLLVTKMQKEADQRGLEAKIQAVAVEEVKSHLNEANVVLVGPQIRYKLKELKEMAADRNIPVEMIHPADYGLVNGKKVLDFALNL